MNERMNQYMNERINEAARDNTQDNRKHYYGRQYIFWNRKLYYIIKVCVSLEKYNMRINL
jgi:hypothetical protein